MCPCEKIVKKNGRASVRMKFKNDFFPWEPGEGMYENGKILEKSWLRRHENFIRIGIGRMEFLLKKSA